MIGVLVPTAALVLHWVLASGVLIRVLLQRRSRGSAFAWIILAMSVPIVGAALYLIVGEVWLPRRRLRRMHHRVLPEQVDERASAEAAAVPGVEAGLLGQIARHARRATGFTLTRGNALELLDGADAAFERMIADIDAARQRCTMVFYIWHAGGRTQRVGDALCRAAQRGVDCRVLLDAHGSRPFLASDGPDRLRDAGVKVRAALPIGPVRLKLHRIDVRNHRKIVAIDGCIAYTGSLNMIDPASFKADAGVGQWVDCLVRLEGPAARDLERVARRDWAFEHDAEAKHEPEFADGSAQAIESAGEVATQVVPSGPRLAPDTLRQMLLRIMYAARREITVTTPYFVPDDATITALASAARSGVRVRLIVPERIDGILVRYATRAYFAELLEAGAEVHHFRGGLLHSKTVRVDDAIAFVGTANMDLRSFELNFEVNLLVLDHGFNAQLRALQERYLQRSGRLDPEAWSRRSAWQTARDNLAQLVAPLL